MAKPSKHKAGKRGRQAGKPSQVPLRGWKDIATRVMDEQTKDNLSIVAAGVAFYFIFAMPPAIASAVSIYGLVADPAQVSRQLDSIAGILPQEAYAILQDQLQSLVQQSGGALGLGMLFGLLLTLWSANKGTKALITSLNIVYDEDESRGFIKLNLWSLMLTIVGIISALIALSLLVVVPVLLQHAIFPDFIQGLLAYARWPFLGVLVIIGLAVLYRLAPDREQPQWKWVSWGSVMAAVLWLIGSVLFSIYVSNFGDFDQTYGSLGAVIILMTWFYMSAYIILLGAEINAEMEHQTRKDTTRGGSKPLGARNAHAADTLGPTKREVDRDKDK